MSLVLYIVFPPQPLNILILGLDAREGEGFGTRADSIIVMGVNARQLRVSVLSIPRDLFLDVPNYGMQRINTINVLGEQAQQGGGSALLRASIEKNFGVQVDRYARLNFEMFVALVDAVGGVSIDVERVIVDNAYPTGVGDGVMQVRFESGIQTMDGARALIYARTRQSDDDYRRAERQQQVLAALAKKLANPLHVPAVLNILTRYVDTDLSLWDLALAAPPVLLNAGRFDQLVINRDYILGTQAGYAVPNYPLVDAWLRGRLK